MYLDKPNDKQWIIDAETDGLNPTVVWVVCVKNVGTREELTLITKQQIREFFDREIKRGCVFIGHNALKFDAYWINRICGTRIPISRIVDTLLLSMVYSPSLDGGHSLEDWGIRLKYPKGEFSDFSRLSDEMIIYCRRDVNLCYLIFTRLIERMRAVGFSEQGIEIEHKAWWIIRKQQLNGFAFNRDEAGVLYSKLLGITRELQEEIYKHWPPQLLKVKEFKNARNKDGKFSKQYEKHREQYPKLDIHNHDNGYSAWDYVEFNLGSPIQRIEKLVELGWVPQEFTKPSKTNPKGNPKVTEKGELVPSLIEFIEQSGNEQVRLLADWITINSRASMINTWMEAYKDKTGCIHGDLWLANTMRYRHSNPNSANIPAVRIAKDGSALMGLEGWYTYEARDLWTTRDRKTRKLVGVDAKGIQLRVLANYLNNPEFTKQLLEGDPHAYNQELAGLRTRAMAKTFIYAFLLGAGDAKIGSIIGGTSKDGREVKSRFIKNFPGLGDLLDNLERQVERTGRIRLCDGTPIIVSRPHTRLGYLLQGDESRIMKKAAILVDELNRKQGLDVLKVGDIHDEWQSDVLNEHVDPYIANCKIVFPTVQELFKYRVPLDCDAKVGLTWAQTH